MNFVKVKSEKELHLNGIKIDCHVVDNEFSAITFTDDEGNCVNITIANYSMKVCKKAPPKMVKKWRINSALSYLEVDELFENKHEAEDKVNELISALGYSAEAVLTIEQIEVEE
jgi:hypothetical protein